MAKQKYYVVWEGREPGVYDNWDDCFEQVNGFPGAKYKAFPSQEAAVSAYRGDGAAEEELLTRIALHTSEAARPVEAAQPGVSVSAKSQPVSAKSQPVSGPASYPDYSRIPEINLSAIATDGACAGNPGVMEYRGVKVATGEEIFHVGPLPDGTNNVAEYLALVHALALLFKQNDGTTPIYTDSGTAVAWVRNRGCCTKLEPTERNRRIFEMIARANVWIRTHTPTNPILRWSTSLWGEIPADFGRK